MAYNSSTADVPPSRSPESTSSGLLESIKGGEPEAWRFLVQLYGPMIYRWCRRAKLQPEDAADVVQEVLAAVAKSVGAYQPLESGGGFRAWLWGITRHRLLDFFRRLRDTPQAEGGTWAQQQMALLPGDPESSSSDASAPAKDPLWHKALELVRAEFEPNTWQAFWHVAVDGRRPADVAQDLGMTVHAVYQAKARVLRKLRTRLAGLEAVE